MAARENQGLQIALIIFVVLTIALSVATFMFFSKFDEEKAKIAEYEKATKDADNKAADYLKELTDLKMVTGVPADQKVEAFRADAMKKDFEEMGTGGADDKQTYRDLARALYKVYKATDQNLIAAQDREKKLGDKIKSDETTKVGEIKVYKKTVDDTSADYTTERGALKEDVTKAATAKTDAQSKFDGARKTFDEQLTKLKSDIQDRDSQIVKLSQVIDRLTEEKRQTELDIEIADGRIRWVNQGEQLVWLDRGSADGLRQQVSFKVIDRDEPNPATAPTKGTIEVIRVTDSHSAEARIVSDDPSDPIMPGDILFSTAWQPGRVEHFALAGFMDVDGDLVSDRATVKQLILNSGGVIDSEVTEDGKMVGEMLVGTKYLIMGDRPNDKNLTADMQKNYTRAIENARKLGIKQMPITTFLDYIGYQPQQKTVSLGRDANSADFRAKLPDVPRKSIGKTIDYSPLRPKPKKSTY